MGEEKESAWHRPLEFGSQEQQWRRRRKNQSNLQIEDTSADEKHRILELAEETRVQVRDLRD
jgi:hypothetical protein